MRWDGSRAVRSKFHVLSVLLGLVMFLVHLPHGTVEKFDPVTVSGHLCKCVIADARGASRTIVHSLLQPGAALVLRLCANLMDHRVRQLPDPPEAPPLCHLFRQAYMDTRSSDTCFVESTNEAASGWFVVTSTSS